MSADNTVILVGRATADPRVTYTQGERSCAIASFNLAVDRHDKDKNADFINCKALGKNGEFIEKFVKKGTKLVVKGAWQTGNYTNKDGQKVYTNECLAETISFAESKNSSGGTDNVPNAKASDPMGGFTPVSGDVPDFMKVSNDNDLPFNPPTR